MKRNLRRGECGCDKARGSTDLLLGAVLLRNMEKVD